MNTTNFKPSKMRISNRFDVPSVKIDNVYYFPQDESKLVKKNGVLKASIQAVFNDGKLRQDTFLIDPEIYINILVYWAKKSN